jgi:hypothetical protein
LLSQGLHNCFFKFYEISLNFPYRQIIEENKIFLKIFLPLENISYLCSVINKNEYMAMTRFLKNNMLYLIGGAAGGVGGYLYYIYVGCESGSCPITSSPTMSILWGAVMGAMLLGAFKKDKKKEAVK